MHAREERHRSQVRHPHCAEVSLVHQQRRLLLCIRRCGRRRLRSLGSQLKQEGIVARVELALQAVLSRRCRAHLSALLLPLPVERQHYHRPQLNCPGRDLCHSL
jgi:hypothetical protein